MSVSNPKKTITPAAISCGGTADVTISFDAAAALMDNPADIILIMDRSGSMAPPKLEYAKAAAVQLIDIVAEATGGSTAIAGESRLGLVSFAGEAKAEAALSKDTALLHDAVNAMVYGGSTNHRAAFEAAETMLPPKGSKRQIAVMFTDGETTTGGDPNPVAERMKAAGVEIYCIGLLTDPVQLKQWASAPADYHIAITAEPAQLEKVFRTIAQKVVLAGAINAVLREELSEDFKITGTEPPTRGVVQITGPRTLLWEAGNAGVTPVPETVSLTFKIMHTGTSGGSLAFNRALVYADEDGNELRFPDPVLDVDCSGKIIFPEPCPAPADFAVEGCRDAAAVRIEDTALRSLGRIVQVDVTIKNVCPGRQMAAAVILTETDANGMEHNRGIKTIAVPAQEGNTCQDITLRCISFVVPEALDVWETPDSICNPRNFRARVIANYTDTDFICCGAETVIS